MAGLWDNLRGYCGGMAVGGIPAIVRNGYAYNGEPTSTHKHTQAGPAAWYFVYIFCIYSVHILIYFHIFLVYIRYIFDMWIFFFAI